MKYNTTIAVPLLFLGVAFTSFIPIVSADDNDPFDISVASGQELCDKFLDEQIEQGVDMSAYLALHYIETYQVCCWSNNPSNCDQLVGVELDPDWNCASNFDFISSPTCSLAIALNQEPADPAPVISVASGQELCDTYLSDMIEQGVDMSAYLALHYIETYQVCCWSTSVDVCDAAWETYNCDPLGDLWVQMVYPGVCSVAEALNQEPGQDSDPFDCADYVPQKPYV